MSFFAGQISDDAYMGTPFTKIHDFSIGALKTFAYDQSMFSVVDCLDMYEVMQVDKALGLSQMLFEHSIQGKMDGATNFVEGFVVYGPETFTTCANAVQEDMQNLATFAGRLNLYGFDIYFANKHEWVAAGSRAEYYRHKNEYEAAGSMYAKTLIELTGGPIPVYGTQNTAQGIAIPHPHIPSLPPLVIPEKVDVAADIFAGILYGITEQEGLDNLGECFYGFDEFVYDIIHAYNMIASKTLPGLLDGFMLGLETLLYIPSDVMACIGAKGDIKPFEEWLA
jgi:hypothetical protein